MTISSGLLAVNHGGTGPLYVGAYGIYTLTNPSDRDIKRDIEPEVRGLDDLVKLNPVSFKFKKGVGMGDSDKIHHGFIAQDVQKVIPEIVHGKDKKVGKHNLGLDSAALVPMIINALKDIDERLKQAGV